MIAAQEIPNNPPVAEIAPQPNLLKPPSRGVGKWVRRLLEWLNVKEEPETGPSTLEETGLIPKGGDYPDLTPKK